MNLWRWRNREGARNVCGVNATDTSRSATAPRLNFDVFDVECATRGALDDTARGKLVGVDRTTIWRWRNGRQFPSLDVVARIADQFGLPVEHLIERRAA